MTKILIDRSTVEQALEALEWHYRQGHSNTLGGLRLKIDEKTLRNLKAALAEPDIDPVDEYRKGFIDGQIDMRDRPAEPVQQGCDHCNHPLYAAVKCKVCGRAHKIGGEG